MNYAWRGINAQQQICQGIITADNISQVKTHLCQQNITILKITAQTQENIFSHNKNDTKTIFPAKRKIKRATRASLIQQLAFLINANIPLLASLETLRQDNKNSACQQLIWQIKNDIAAGHTLTHALQKYPQYFPPLWCNLINTGEQSGTLATMLNHIALHIANTHKQKHKIIKALLYPACVMLITLAVTAIMLVFVIPRFQEMYSDFGKALPLYTQFIINASSTLKHNGMLIIGLLITTITSIIFASKKSPAFAEFLEMLALRLPLCGTILHKHYSLQYAHTLHVTTKAGIPLIEALTISANNINSLRYQKSISQIKEALIHGRALHVAMREQNLFTERILQLVMLGEESGTLENMFAEITNYYTEEINYIIDNLNNLLEPLIMLILAVIVGSLIIGMYLPIFRLGSIM